TGGASGIGAACVALLRERGATVIVADLDVEKAAAVAENPEQAFQLDVSQPDEVEQLALKLETAGLEVEYLVNCAGIVQSPLPPHELAIDAYRQVIDVDLE